METENPNVAIDSPMKKEKNKKKTLLLVGLLSTILIIGTYYFMLAAGYEGTDNAQLDADIVPVRSSISGFIKKVNFKDNSQVKKGDTLLLIEESDLKTKVMQAEAALENAKANLISVKNNANATDANASAAIMSSAYVEETVNGAKAKLTKSKADFKRTEKMFAEKAATQSQYDAAKAELDIAQSQFDGTVHQFQSSKSQSQGVRSQAAAQSAMIAIAEALVKQREAELSLAKNQLNNSYILAPCNGVVSKRMVEAGQYISIAQALCSVVNTSEIWVTANFKETQVKKIKTGQTVKVSIDAFPNIELSGKVSSFIGATGAKFSLLPPDNSTGNFVKITQRVPIRIDLDALPKENANVLIPGLSAYVEISVK